MFNPSNWKATEVEIKEARLDSNDRWGYGITFDDGSGVGISSKVNPQDFQIHPGKAIVFAEREFGLGQSIRGLIQDGWVIFYNTREQARADGELWTMNYDKRKEEEYKKSISSWVTKGEALSEPYRKRLERFTTKNGLEWWREDGGYELFILEQSDAMVKHFKTADALNDWSKLPWDQQKAAFPQLDEGHSGNTFGGAVALARAVMEGRDI